MKELDRVAGKIEDARIAGYTKRTRNGSQQVFYTGNDSRDFDRYKKEGGGSAGHNVDMHDKPDTIRIDAPHRHWYAELIAGEWYWLDGCDQCNGRPRNGYSYLGECDEHNRCAHCNKKRSDLQDKSVWGNKNGWECNSCHDALHEAAKNAALAAMPEDYDAWDYEGLDEITCPYCKYEFSDSWESADDDGNEHDCPRCDNTFKVTAVHSVVFDCVRIGGDE